MTAPDAAWCVYERLIARLMADQVSTDLCVTPNARIKGVISGRSRQLDVLIDARHDTDNSRRIIVDAKKRRRKIDVIHVEAFKGLMEDVGATHGFLVCPVGHTQSAEKRAQETVTIRLVPLEYLDNFNPATWPNCHNERCRNGRVFWDGYPEFSLGLRPVDAPNSPGGLRIPFVHFVGKCDRCGRFHVQCIHSEQIFSFADDGEHAGCCKPLGFWLSSIEESDDKRPSAELHAIMLNGSVVTVDRRPM